MRLWNNCTTPLSTLPDDARKEYMTRVVFFFATLFTLPAAFITLLMYQARIVPANMSIFSGLASVVLLIGWVLIHRRQWKVARHTIVIITYITALYISVTYGFDAPGMLFFVAMILLAAMMNPPKIMWSYALIGSITAASVAWGEFKGWLIVPSPGIFISLPAVLFIVALIFSGVGALLHFLIFQFEKALTTAEATSQELKAYQEQLESLVAERTAQLKKEVEERRQSEHALIKAQHIARFGVWEWDIFSGQLSWDKETARVFRLDLDETNATITGFLKFVHPDDRVPLENSFLEAYHDRKRGFNINHRVVLPDGETRMVHQEAEFVYENSDNPIRVFGVVHDITKQWQAGNELQKSLAEKELLLKEIHHRVKNNLQTVAGLLYLQARQTHNPAAQDALRNSYNRVQSMALVHQQLYQTTNISHIELRSYITKLIRQLRQSYAGSRSIIFRTDIAPVHFNLDTIIPLGLILNELITNAMKHAFTDRDVIGEIEITFRQENGMNILSVMDSGAGFSAEQQALLRERGFGGLTTNSLGLLLVQQLTRQLHGEITVTTDPHTRFDITF